MRVMIRLAGIHPFRALLHSLPCEDSNARTQAAWLAHRHSSMHGCCPGMRITEVVTERQQFELYYPPFRAAVEAGVGSFMCSCESVSSA